MTADNQNHQKTAIQDIILQNIEDSDDVTWDDILIDDKVQIQQEPDYYTQKNIEITLEAKIDENNLQRDCQICEKCKTNLVKKQSISICPKCGLEYEYETTTGEYAPGYREGVADDGSFFAFQISSSGTHKIRRYGCSSSLRKDTHNENINKRAMLKFDKKNERGHLPPHVLRDASEKYAEIQKHKYMFRRDHRMGVIGAILYYLCYMNGIGKPPAEIARYLGIEEKFLSYGDRVLRDLVERGILDIPLRILPIRQFAQTYLRLLQIDKKEHEDFIVDLVQRADEKKLHMLYDSKNNTKCVGALYVLVERMPHLRDKVTKEMIEQTCKISRTTFLKYYKLIMSFPRTMKPIFKKYGVPMPNEWRVL